MNTKRPSFQLEQTVPGAFLLQGFLGGALGLFLYVVLVSLNKEADENVSNNIGHTLLFTPIYMLCGGMLGVIKATIMWGIRRVTGLNMPAFARVVMTTVAIGLVAVLVKLQLPPDDSRAFAITLVIGWLTALPTALLVGSGVKPWELFTFGSIAVSNGRSGSRSVWATLGTLPLRFVSLIALGAWIVTFACHWSQNQRRMPEVLFFFSIPASYLCLSAYFTFRSPHKASLFVIGLTMNVPIALLALLCYMNYQQMHRSDELYSAGICGTFLFAWILLLLARVTVRAQVVSPHNMSPLKISSPAFTPRIAESEHRCLGSRFLEWHEHAA